MYLFEFINKEEFTTYITVAFTKQEAIDKIVNYSIKESSKETTINTVINISTDISLLKSELFSSEIKVYRLEEYIGVFSVV